MFMGSQKNEYIFRYEAFVDIFGIITKLDHIHGLFPCILGYFLKIKVQNVGYFLGLLKFQIFFGDA